MIIIFNLFEHGVWVLEPAVKYVLLGLKCGYSGVVSGYSYSGSLEIEFMFFLQLQCWSLLLLYDPDLYLEILLDLHNYYILLSYLIAGP